jgi:hypothetical protein
MTKSSFEENFLSMQRGERDFTKLSEENLRGTGGKE